MNINSRAEKISKLRAHHARAVAAPPVLDEGQRMEDGSIYAGLSPDTGAQMFVMPEDAAGRKTIHQSLAYKDTINREKRLGHNDWVLPSSAELEQLLALQQRGALKESFAEALAEQEEWYWSGTINPKDGRYWAHCLDGTGMLGATRDPARVRCIRREAAPA